MWLGLRFCIYKRLLIPLELWRCIYTGDLLSIRFSGGLVRIASLSRALFLFYAAGGITRRAYLVQAEWVAQFFLTGGAVENGDGNR